MTKAACAIMLKNLAKRVIPACSLLAGIHINFFHGGKKMKYTLILISLLLVYPIHWVIAKSEKELYIETASQFQRYCKQLSYRHFRKKKQQPYNWSASTIRQLNDYQVSGSWKVNNVEMQVYCQIRIGKKAKYTKMKINQKN